MYTGMGSLGYSATIQSSSSPVAVLHDLRLLDNEFALFVLLCSLVRLLLHTMQYTRTKTNKDEAGHDT